MRTSLTLAGRGLGLVSPNPAVGCIITNSAGTIVGRGWTQPGGRPHAETEAIKRAGEQCRGGTAYVTLEPCDHQGQSPPCSEALIDAGIGRVVVACQDPDPRVRGKGVKRLQDAGIDVLEGVLKKEARALNAGFFKRISDGRPLFTLKAATTLDGRIATQTGDSQWITGAQARAAGHRLRARHDAILTGIGTVLADNPSLTCRLPGMESYSPVRVVADSTLKLPLSSQLVETADAIQTMIISSPEAEVDKVSKLEGMGCTVCQVATNSTGHPAPAAIADALGEMGLTRVLIEGGGALAGSFMSAGLVDRLAWFRAPKIIGGDGVSSVAPFGVEDLSAALSFTRTGLYQCGEDVLETFEKKDPP